MAGLAESARPPLRMSSYMHGHTEKQQDRVAHMEMTALRERPKSVESIKAESSSLTALTEEGDYVLDSCSERNFDNHGCSKTNKLILVVINGWETTTTVKIRFHVNIKRENNFHVIFQIYGS